MSHDIVTVRPWCGDCGKARGHLYCDQCLYALCDRCAHLHNDQKAGA